MLTKQHIRVLKLQNNQTCKSNMLLLVETIVTITHMVITEQIVWHRIAYEQPLECNCKIRLNIFNRRDAYNYEYIII